MTTEAIGVVRGAGKGTDDAIGRGLFAGGPDCGGVVIPAGLGVDPQVARSKLVTIAPARRETWERMACPPDAVIVIRRSAAALVTSRIAGENPGSYEAAEPAGFGPPIHHDDAAGRGIDLPICHHLTAMQNWTSRNLPHGRRKVIRP
jgi:hypothetical protein